MTRTASASMLPLLLVAAALCPLVGGTGLGAPSLTGAAPITAIQPELGDDALLAHLRENVSVQEDALLAMRSLYEAGRASEADLLRARIAQADAERLVGEVTADQALLRVPDELRVQLYERLLADAALKPDETDPVDVAGWSQSLAEARVRLWRLDQSR